jgi:hypothetical protein
VQIVDLLRIHCGQASRQEVRLLLIVALQRNPVSRADERLQCWDDLLRWQNPAARQLLDPLQAAGFLLAAGAPAGG